MADTRIKNWAALEANPEVLTQFMHSLGANASYEFTDVFGFDPDLLAMVPQPVVAVLLLFPVDEHYQKYRHQQEEKIKADGQTLSKNLYFMKQTIGNACGTIGVLHSVLNNSSSVIGSDGFFKAFLNKTKEMTPDERAAALFDDQQIDTVHASSAQQGQSREIPPEEDVDLHFISFVQVDGNLYELDGTKPFPINHGASSADSILQDAVKVIQKIIALNPEENRFTVLALVSQSNE
eukprot:TRINITY_DN1399_c0_g1_i1.p1 TRINITY_DN1399_c0_g1~~TRINITY_DN1399_c0_g1_i1.p1  ORF type:complete len:236 (+),score=80.37 TRINITY_DN1399_c0_g1_i1:68-775(+)